MTQEKIQRRPSIQIIDMVPSTWSKTENDKETEVNEVFRGQNILPTHIFILLKGKGVCKAQIQFFTLYLC